MLRRVFMKGRKCMAVYGVILCMTSLLSGCGLVGNTVSSAQIKREYANDGSAYEYREPIFNVPTDGSLYYDFKCHFDDVDDYMMNHLVITVHTDESCSKESELVISTRVVQNEDGGSRIIVSPLEAVLSNDTQEEMDINNEYVWGGAPIYYMCIHYDTNTEEPTKLEKPIIVPFTVKSEVEVPNLYSKVDEKGCLSLYWDEIEGADSYNIYHFYSEDSDGRNSKEVAYKNGSLFKIDSTTDTSFSDFFEDGSSGIIESYDLFYGGDYVYKQNAGVYGDYYVTAVVDGKESNVSNGISTNNLKIPSMIVDEDDPYGFNADNIEDYPRKIGVENVDGSITKHRVSYTYLEDVEVLGMPMIRYSYKVEGTALDGTVALYNGNGIDMPESVGELEKSGNAEPYDLINKVPHVERKTNFIKQHNVKIDNDLYVNADTDEEAWLAWNMVNGNEDIYIGDFPELTDPYLLSDTIYKVYYQNPYIMGVYSFSCDYSNMVLKVDYLYKDSKLDSMQDKVDEESEDILNDIIDKDMSDEDKIYAIYTWFEDNCEYDDEAYKDCADNKYMKQDSDKYEYAYNAYGAIVEHKALCQGYAAGFNLLCNKAGIRSELITGYMNGISPHAWNGVCIDDKWYQIDVTNNGKNSGVPFYLYEANKSVAEEIGYSMGDRFTTDNALSRYKEEDTTREYYVRNELVVDSIEDFEEVLENNKDDKIVVRYKDDLLIKDMVNSVKLYYNMSGKEDKLAKMKYKALDNYMVIE